MIRCDYCDALAHHMLTHGSRESRRFSCPAHHHMRYTNVEPLADRPRHVARSFEDLAAILSRQASGRAPHSARKRVTAADS